MQPLTRTKVAQFKLQYFGVKNMKELLIVVDYQNDFVGGSLGFADAPKLHDYIVNEILKAEKNGVDVVFTKDTHLDNYMETEEGKNLPVKHCIKGTKGWNFYGKVEELSKNHKVFEKYTFPSGDLYEYLKDKDYEQITLMGLVSTICVISNAIIAKAALPNAHIVVDSKGSDSYDKVMQEKGYDIMKNLHIEVK